MCSSDSAAHLPIHPEESVRQWTVTGLNTYDSPWRKKLLSRWVGFLVSFFVAPHPCKTGMQALQAWGGMRLRHPSLGPWLAFLAHNPTRQQ